MSLKTNNDRRMVHYHQPVGLSTLFRPLPKCDPENRPKLNVTYRAATGGPTLRFSAKAALGIPEQTLLLVLLELAKQQYEAFGNKMVLDSEAEGEFNQDLWSRLNKQNQLADGQTLRLETTWYELNRQCGSQTGGSSRAMREQQLERLCEVTVWEEEGDEKKTKRQSFLVVWLIGDDDRIHLALNSGLASALLGKPYAQVSLGERLSLGRDIPMAVHTFLSTTVSYGNHLKVKVDTLVERLWPGCAESALSGTRRRRRKFVADALDDIGRLNEWTVQWERDDLAQVTRHSLGVTDMTSHIGNKSMSYRERALPIIINKNKELQSFDVSGLFFNKNTGA